MDNNESTQPFWNIESHQAILSTDMLKATVDLRNPGCGLQTLRLAGKTVDGFALGASPNGVQSIAREAIGDAFVRGNDLVVTYTQTDERPFALQVYWRVVRPSQGGVIVDTILSLQTDLLESFPEVEVTSNLPADSVWWLPDFCDGNVQRVAEQAELDRDTVVTRDLLIRFPTCNFSYAQRTHPDDRGRIQASRTSSGVTIASRLGGRFLEKGVIRRLLVRGVFVPQEHDLQLANNYLTALETEQPPLTA